MIAGSPFMAQFLRVRAGLFGGESEGVPAVLNHLAHLADAFSTLRGTLVALENIGGPRGPGLDGAGDVPLAKAIAVADVQGRRSCRPVAIGSL
jgi:hypothetical protein